MGSRASQPAKEKAPAPGTANRRAYGLKNVRGDTAVLALPGHRRVRGSPAGPSDGAPTVATGDDDPPAVSGGFRDDAVSVHAQLVVLHESDGEHLLAHSSIRMRMLSSPITRRRSRRTAL